MGVFDHAVGADLQTQFIGKIQKTEYRLQQMVSIGSATDDMQKKIQFSGSRKGMHGLSVDVFRRS